MVPESFTLRYQTIRNTDELLAHLWIRDHGTCAANFCSPTKVCPNFLCNQSSPNVHNYFVRGIEIPTPPWVQEWFHWSTRLGIEAIKPPWWSLISMWQLHSALWNNKGKDYQQRIQSIGNCYFLQGFEVFKPPWFNGVRGLSKIIMAK